MQRPDKYPEWATNNVVSPITKQNNAIEPPTSHKNFGYEAFEQVGRNWLNWLFRYFSNWITYLDSPDPFTVATLPTVSTYPLGKIIFVTDESGGSVPAFNDGTNWRRVTDRNIVS
jgi:hypothetical protein